jgi:GH35 family endo-1,4-beta-xylanase
MNRRHFLRVGALGAATLGATPPGAHAEFRNLRPAGDLVLRPYPDRAMPPLTYAYAADEHEDPFVSPLTIDRSGVVMPGGATDRRFSVNARWLVQDVGYLWLSADNHGELYSADNPGAGPRTLNYEFASSRVRRNGLVLSRYRQEKTVFSPEVTHLVTLSEELLEDARRAVGDPERCARHADRALSYAVRAGERIELERARDIIARHRRAEQVYFGCETRQMVWAKSEEFTRRFTELFNFATITHYPWDTWYPLFEPREGEYRWGIKDDIVRWLEPHGVTLEGRPLFWFHPSVTPEWLARKSFDEVRRYVERHTRDLVGHYGDRVLQWEVVNEIHDWANIHNFTPGQITDLVRLACERTREANPQVVRILNNCAPWAEYAARGRMARMDATRPLRSPRRFLQDLADAGVEYDVLGIQLYFPQRDLSDVVRLLERLESFSKPMYITEIGAGSGSPAPDSHATTAGGEPYSWHRAWDEELQAEWLEQVYTIFYSRPLIRAINWYDFSDFRPFIVNGGLVREDGSPKRAFHVLRDLLASWNRLPAIPTGTP